MTNYTEWTDSKNPVLILLRKLCWQNLTRKQCERERGGILSNVILKKIWKNNLTIVSSLRRKMGGGREANFKSVRIVGLKYKFNPVPRAMLLLQGGIECKRIRRRI